MDYIFFSDLNHANIIKKINRFKIKQFLVILNRKKETILISTFFSLKLVYIYYVCLYKLYFLILYDFLKFDS